VIFDWCFNQLAEIRAEACWFYDRQQGSTSTPSLELLFFPTRLRRQRIHFGSDGVRQFLIDNASFIYENIRGWLPFR